MDGLLKDLRVLDLTQGISGAYCTMNLGDYGAEVVKIEPVSGDSTRTLGNPVGDTSPLYVQFNRNKKSLAVNLETAEGQAVLAKLVDSADILVENLTEKQKKDWNLNYETLKVRNKNLIHASLSGYGANSPMSGLPEDNLVLTAFSGLMDRTGKRGTPPMKPGVDLAGMYTGITLMSGVAMALFQRLNSGEGSYFTVSTLDSMFYMLELYVMNHSIDGKIVEKNGNQDTEIAPLGVFEAADGFVAIATSSDSQWESFCDIAKAPQLKENPKFTENQGRMDNLEELIAAINGVTSQWKSQDLVDALCENKLSASVVKSIGQLTQDPQVQATEMLLEANHPQLGKHLMVGSPMKLGLTPTNPTANPAPSLGQHTQEVLLSLGYPEGDITNLVSQGVLSTGK